MSTIIIGGGIIGLSTAYYLAQLSQTDIASAHDIHIIDNASELFASASGYAGGFIAKDWFSPAVASLGALSFKLHKDLATKHNGAQRWGYAPSDAYSLSIDDRGVAAPRSIAQRRAAAAPGADSGGDAEDWLASGTSRATASTSITKNDDKQEITSTEDEMLNPDGTPAFLTRQSNSSLEPISSPSSCAQVSPRDLCEFLLEECEKMGVKVHTCCTATGICKGEDGRVNAIKIKKDNEIFEKHCTNIIVAAGAWSPKAFSSLFHDTTARIPIGSLAGYSVVVRSPRHRRPIIGSENHAQCHAIFCGPSPSWSFAPELFTRNPRDKAAEIYVAGLNAERLELPESVHGVEALVDPDAVDELRKATVLLTGLAGTGKGVATDDLELVRSGLCFRPVSASGRPVVARVDEGMLGKDVRMQDVGGVFVAAGHGPWGISLSLGTGRVVAEMVLRRETSADVSRLGF